VPPNGREDGLRVGEVLKQARSRLQLDIREVEQRTKIRVKYLRALEEEQWEVLPAPAYTRSFLRTYARNLGLDGEALVDEYDRQVQADSDAQLYPLGEPFLEQRLRPGAQPSPWRRRLAIIAALALALAAVLVVLGLTGGNDKGGGHHKGKGAHHGHQQGHGEGSSGDETTTTTSQVVSMTIDPHAPVQACLVRGDGEVLVYPQTTLDSRQGPYTAEDFRLDVANGGALDLTLNGKIQSVTSSGPITYQIDPSGVQRTSYKGPSCP